MNRDEPLDNSQGILNKFSYCVYSIRNLIIIILDTSTRYGIMPSITTTQEVMLLQLQYVAESCGLRRTYLPESGDIPTISADIEPPEADTVTKDSAQALLRKTQPDIEWLPSLKTYLDRVERLSKTSHDRPITVPEGFPRHIDAARVWSGDDFSDSEVYIVRLNEHDVLEVKSALAFLKG